MFSLAFSPDTVIVGLGYTVETSDGSVQAGLGFHLSTDGGKSWPFIKNPNEQDNDTSFVYGGVRYPNLPVTKEEQSPSFEVSPAGKTLFSANWVSELVHSQDFGQQWYRISLTPQLADSLVSEQEYEFSGNEGNNLSIGLGLKYYISDLHNKLPNARTIGVDIGMLYRFSEQLQARAIIRNLLASYSWNSGSLYGDDSSVRTENFPRQIQLGLTYKLVSTLLVSLEGDQLRHKNHVENNLRIGSSYKLHDRITLRGVL